MIHIVSQKLILLLPTNWPRISSFFIGACFHPQSGGNRDSKWPAGMNELLFCMSECLYWFPCLLSSQCRDSLQPLLWPWKETGGWRIGITSKSKHAASCFFPSPYSCIFLMLLHHYTVFSFFFFYLGISDNIFLYHKELWLDVTPASAKDTIFHWCLLSYLRPGLSYILSSRLDLTRTDSEEQR